MDVEQSPYAHDATEVGLIDEMLETTTGYAVGPVRALLEALLFDGVQAYLSYVMAQSEEEGSRFEEAYRWVHHSDDGYVFSFENVCDALGIDSDYLRLGLINASNSQSFEWKRMRRSF